MTNKLTEEKLSAFLEESSKFVKAAVGSLKEGEYQAEFICPLCGGDAMVVKAEVNGHHMANCSKCGINFRE